MLTTIDHALLQMINGWAGQSAAFDLIVSEISRNHLFKGVFSAMLVWSLWFWPGADEERRRIRLISLMAVAVIAIFVGRGLANFLPFRLRPIHDPDVDASIPFGEVAGALDGWSSFPSDHGVLFFALAAGLWQVNRTVGIIALAHALVIVSLPRIFRGVHFPGDILAGALVGVLLALLLVPLVERLFKAMGVYSFFVRLPQLAYPLLFFVTFQIGTMFEPLRFLARQSREIIRVLI